MNKVITKSSIKLATNKRTPAEIRKRWDAQLADALSNSKRYSISELDQMFSDIKNV